MDPNVFGRVKMVRYLEAASSGGSRSHIMASEDGSIFFVKFKENPQGIRVLVNELVANKIACLLDLPCPEGFIAELGERFLLASKISPMDGKTISPGQHFCCRQIENIYHGVPRNLIPNVKNTKHFPGIILFDMFVNNSDRNSDGNYLIVNAKDNSYELCIIDHGHCFGNPVWDTTITDRVGTWSQSILPPMANYIRGFNPFQEYIEKVKTLSNKLFSSMVADIPNEWEINESERRALTGFLIGQRDKIEEITLKYKDQFPLWI